MDKGVSFYDGMDACKFGGESTQPSAPSKSSGGPIKSPEGLDEGSSFSNTSNSQAEGGNPGGLGSKWSSPTDK
jgi:hypothetical protein